MLNYFVSNTIKLAKMNNFDGISFIKVLYSVEKQYISVKKYITVYKKIICKTVFLI